MDELDVSAFCKSKLEVHDDDGIDMRSQTSPIAAKRKCRSFRPLTNEQGACSTPALHRKKQRRERTPKESLEDNACDNSPEMIAIERSDKRCRVRIREQPDEDTASGDSFATHVLAGSGKHCFPRIAGEAMEDDAFDDGMEVLGTGGSDNHNRARLQTPELVQVKELELVHASVGVYKS